MAYGGCSLVLAGQVRVVMLKDEIDYDSDYDNDYDSGYDNDYDNDYDKDYDKGGTGPFNPADRTCRPGRVSSPGASTR